MPEKMKKFLEHNAHFAQKWIVEWQRKTGLLSEILNKYVLHVHR